jgi:hypothetical protein
MGAIAPPVSLSPGNVSAQPTGVFSSFIAVVQQINTTNDPGQLIGLAQQALGELDHINPAQLSPEVLEHNGIDSVETLATLVARCIAYITYYDVAALVPSWMANEGLAPATLTEIAKLHAQFGSWEGFIPPARKLGSDSLVQHSVHGDRVDSGLGRR